MNRWGLSEALGSTVNGKPNTNPNASNQALYGLGDTGNLLRGTLAGLIAGTAAAFKIDKTLILSNTRLMKSISASNAKQIFGSLLADAAREPVRIERHGKTVAAMVPPSWLDPMQDRDPRRVARAAQCERERDRATRHLKLAVKLLTLPPAERDDLIAQAKAMVDLWQAGHLCSDDYISRWRAWLDLPPTELARAMTSPDDEWAAPMRQNSPFVLPA